MEVFHLAGKTYVATPEDRKQQAVGFAPGKVVSTAGFRHIAAGTVDDGPPKEKSRPGKGGSSELVVRPEKDIPNSPDLQALAAQIKAERDAFERKSLESAQHIVRLGELLDEVRRAIGHGGWLKWIETNTGISKSTVYNYIELTAATRTGEIDLPTVGSLGLKAALKMIAKPKAKPAPKQQAAAGKLNLDDAQVTEIANADTEPSTTATAEIHIFDRILGPLSGAEWAELGQRHLLRGYRDGKSHYSEIYLKLIAFHAVPLQELEAAE